MQRMNELPKAPRWISTTAGLWAWQAHGVWRATATNALSVHDRRQLLYEAEQLHDSCEQRTGTVTEG
jgi:hypothetical protein